MSWEARWEEGRTPWDAGKSAPVLHELVAADALPHGRAFVPGAGSGYDLLTLASEQRTTVGLDLAPVAKTQFETLAAGHPHRARTEYVVGDAFTYAPQTRFDLMWDYTFLCALPAKLRPQWAALVDRVLAPHGELVALIFPVVPDADPDEGPPYPMTPELVTDLLAPGFSVKSIAPVERSNPGRSGKEWLGRFVRA